MSEKIKHKIFTSTDCISEQTMFDYIDGKLNAKEQHIVEKHMLDCELCSDAIEGLRLTKDRTRIDLINAAIRKQIAGSDRKIISINYSVITSIAAGLLLLFGGIFFFNHFVSGKKEVAELKAPEETKKQNDHTPAFEKESNEPVPATTITKESSSSAPAEKNAKVQLEDKEELIEKQSEPLLEKDNISSGTAVAVDEIKPSSPPSSIVSDKDYKTISSSENANKTAPDNNILKDNNNRDDSKNTDEESKSESQNNEGYSLKQDLPSKYAERATKSEAKKKEKQKEEKPSATGNVAYAPESVTLSNADQTTTMDSDISEADEPVYTTVDEMPKYPGGETELIKYIQKNIEYPALKKEDELVTTLNIQFIVDSNGKASKAKLLKPINKELEMKLIESIGKMPKWTPGKLNGKSVNVLFNLPVKIDVK